MKFKLVQLNGDTCAGCAENLWGIKEIIAQRDDIEFIEVGDLDEIKKYVEQYQCTHLPSLLLLKDEKCLGIVHGYQPFEILAYYVDIKISDYLKKEEER